MDTTRREAYLEQYRTGPGRLRKKYATVPGEARQFSPGPDRWSPHQIVIHVVDSDLNNLPRFRKPIAEPGGEVGVYDQDAWARTLPYHELSTDLALELLELYRRYTFSYLSLIGDADWANEISHPENGIMTLGDVLRLYANHIDEHIRQIDLTVDAWTRTQRGETVDATQSYWAPWEEDPLA